MVEVEMWFVLTCRVCGEPFNVGATKLFDEARTGLRLTAYNGRRPWRDDSLGCVGVSRGDGDSFECLPCHAQKWYDALGALAAARPSSGDAT